VYSAALLTFTYISKCSILNSEIISNISLANHLADTDKDDVNALLNYYISACLACAKSKNVEQLPSAETSAPAVSSSVDETERGLFCISGGTLCDIGKLNKKRMLNAKCTPTQRQRAKLVYLCVQKISMSVTDKANDLPVALKDRDRGAMVFPKKVLLPYVTAVNKATMHFLSEEALQKYGKNLLKVSVIKSKII
jgi:hypothetical protein